MEPPPLDTPRPPTVILPALCALAVLLAGGTAHASGLPRDAHCEPLVARPGAPRLCIRGNAVLAEGVYRALLSPPPDVRADEEAAANVQGQLSSFLTRAGYTLGSVAVTVEGADLLADVDEGQLERVVLRGRLSWRALRLWLGLSIPSGVFNQGALEQQLARLREDLRLERVWYELVPTRGVTHTGPQADELAVLQSLGVAEARHPFELHVFVQEPAWREGVGVEVRSGAQYGQEVLGAYQGSGLLLGRDRWSARMGVGMRLQHPVGEGPLRPVPTRVLGEVRWFAPPLIGASARPYLLLQGDVVRERRGDLGLEASYQLATAGSLNLLVEPWRRLTLSTGVGGRYADVLAVDTVGGTAALPEVAAQVHQPRMDLFVQARAERIFSGQAGRVDRMHALSLEARHHLGVKEPSFTEVRAEYRKAWGIGWHDLLLRGRGTYLLGPVAYPDEEPLSRHLRGIAGDEHLRRGGSVSAEFQWSLLRDVYRASVFHDFATFGRLERAAGSERLTWGNSFGVGLHALYEGTLQFNLYGALGKTPEDQALRKGFVFEVQKVF